MCILQQKVALWSREIALLTFEHVANDKVAIGKRKALIYATRH